MAVTDVEALQRAIQQRWAGTLNGKVTQYIGKFLNTNRMGTKISGKVQGNHGIYTVTIELESDMLVSACSCYIGKHGYCHHCIALAHTFLRKPDAFPEIKPRKRDEVQNLQTLGEYLKSITLDVLLTELKSRGITHKAFAESLGMSPRQLSAIRSGELRNRYYGQLGATKLACLWVLEHLTE